MSRHALVLRPEPGNRETVERLADLGIAAIAMPLFEVVPVAWTPPPADAFDALLLTSANAVRHGGAELAALRSLPVVAVGEATARAAGEAGFAVAIVGTGDAAAAVAQARMAGIDRLLRAGGRERGVVDGVVDMSVYASEAVALPPGALAVAAGTVALLHSARAAQVFASLIDRDGVDRGTVGIVVISPAVAAAAGAGWGAVAHAAAPSDAALVRCAAACAIDP